MCRFEMVFLPKAGPDEVANGSLCCDVQCSYSTKQACWQRAMQVCQRARVFSQVGFVLSGFSSRGFFLK